ncbi:hypothetical protein BU14_0148s0005 [Porphyra umbilicalis]|uniref:Uncharacterized protein n=1 Tax=Porphyra umbilicalis TaxID=2786 RepID=A0A1X6P948_PORUM|nr:hypothetical protein BU14_0148s0005 [Porphyra umbilicalis]|eukprot:OSX77429.1 hypothetical protein BU14_0148s0005 [Porphyra umbilicalis]
MRPFSADESTPTTPARSRRARFRPYHRGRDGSPAAAGGRTTTAALGAAGAAGSQRWRRRRHSAAGVRVGAAVGAAAPPLPPNHALSPPARPPRPPSNAAAPRRPSASDRRRRSQPRRTTPPTGATPTPPPPPPTRGTAPLHSPHARRRHPHRVWVGMLAAGSVACAIAGAFFLRSAAVRCFHATSAELKDVHQPTESVDVTEAPPPTYGDERYYALVVWVSNDALRSSEARVSR